jgi:hypothetical protein
LKDTIVRPGCITPVNLIRFNNRIITIVAERPFAEIETIYVRDWKSLCTASSSPACGTAEEAAERIVIALDFGWRSGSPLR